MRARFIFIIGSLLLIAIAVSLIGKKTLLTYFSHAQSSDNKVKTPIGKYHITAEIRCADGRLASYSEVDGGGVFFKQFGPESKGGLNSFRPIYPGIFEVDIPVQTPEDNFTMFAVRSYSGDENDEMAERYPIDMPQGMKIAINKYPFPNPFKEGRRVEVTWSASSLSPGDYKVVFDDRTINGAGLSACDSKPKTWKVNVGLTCKDGSRLKSELAATKPWVAIWPGETSALKPTIMPTMNGGKGVIDITSNHYKNNIYLGLQANDGSYLTPDPQSQSNRKDFPRGLDAPFDSTIDQRKSVVEITRSFKPKIPTFQWRRHELAPSSQQAFVNGTDGSYSLNFYAPPAWCDHKVELLTSFGSNNPGVIRNCGKGRLCSFDSDMFSIFDISDHSKPELYSDDHIYLPDYKSYIGYGGGSNIHLSDTWLLIGAPATYGVDFSNFTPHVNGMAVVDIVDPKAPRLKFLDEKLYGDYEFVDDTHVVGLDYKRMWSFGGSIYFGLGSPKLFSFSLSDTGATILSSVPMARDGSYLNLYDGFAYVMTRDSLEIFDISNLNAIKHMTSLDLSKNATGSFYIPKVHDGYLYYVFAPAPCGDSIAGIPPCRDQLYRVKLEGAQTNSIEQLTSFEGSWNFANDYIFKKDNIIFVMKRKDGDQSRENDTYSIDAFDMVRKKWETLLSNQFAYYFSDILDIGGDDFAVINRFNKPSKIEIYTILKP